MPTTEVITPLNTQVVVSSNIIRLEAQAPYVWAVGDATQIPIIMRGATSQTADLTEWQDVSSAVLVAIGPDGKLKFSTDVNLYKSTTNTLKTDNNFIVAGSLTIAGGSPGAGKVLTSDAIGLASWQTPAAGGSTGVSLGKVLALGS